MTVIMSFGTKAYVPIEQYEALKELLKKFIEDPSIYLEDRMTNGGYEGDVCKLCEAFQEKSHPRPPFPHTESCPIVLAKELVK